MTALIHLIDSLYYSSRISAVRVRKLGIALTLFNVIILFSRFANTIQAPLTGSLVDGAVLGYANTVPVDVLYALAWKFRYILLSATFGSIIGAVLLPSFVNIFNRALAAFEREEASVFKLLWRLTKPRTYMIMAEAFRPPRVGKPEHYKKRNLPVGFLVGNIVLQAIYTTGVLSTIFSGALILDQRVTAANLSGVINWIATILLVLLVDPSVALITDQAIAKERDQHDVTTMVWYLMSGKIIGTLLAQLFFLPAAGLIAAVAQIIAKPAAILDPASLLQFFPKFF